MKSSWSVGRSLFFCKQVGGFVISPAIRRGRAAFIQIYRFLLPTMAGQ